MSNRGKVTEVLSCFVTAVPSSKSLHLTSYQENCGMSTSDKIEIEILDMFNDLKADKALELETFSKVPTKQLTFFLQALLKMQGHIQYEFEYINCKTAMFISKCYAEHIYILGRHLLAKVTYKKVDILCALQLQE